jgi:hypothetical protein
LELGTILADELSVRLKSPTKNRSIDRNAANMSRLSGPLWFLKLAVGFVFALCFSRMARAEPLACSNFFSVEGILSEFLQIMPNPDRQADGQKLAILARKIRAELPDDLSAAFFQTGSGRFREQYRLTPADQSGFSFYLVRETYRLYYSVGSVATTVARVERLSAPKIPGDENPGAFKSSRMALYLWQREISDAVGFVLDLYKERRKNWPASFRDKLRQTAFNFAEQSTYDNIRQEYAGSFKARRSRGLIATIRLVEAKNGILPSEDYLGVRFNSRGLQKVEPGNFGIAKDLNAELFGQLFVHFLGGTMSGRQGGVEKIYFTYADAASFAMYRRLGLYPVPAGDVVPEPGTVLIAGRRPADGVAIEKDNIFWTPMMATQADLDGILEAYFGRRGTPKDPSYIEAVRLRHQETDAKGPNATFFGSNLLTDDVMREARVDLTPPGISRSGETVIRVSMTYARDPGRAYPPLEIPVSELPLHNGSGGVDCWGTKWSFRNGVLSADTNDFTPPAYMTEGHDEFWVSPDLTTVYRAKGELRKNGRPVYRIDAIL